jgi:hypothetical protein
MWPNDLPMAAIVPVGPGAGQENRRVPWALTHQPQAPTSPACSYGDKCQRAILLTGKSTASGQAVATQLGAVPWRAPSPRHHRGPRCASACP